MKTKFYFLLLLTILASCSKKTTIEEILIGKPGEYWTYYNPSSSDFTYYKFTTDKFTERYFRDSNNVFVKYKASGSNDVIEIPLKWSVSKDSILRFNGFAYDVASYNENAVVLYFKDLQTKNERMIFLIKEKEDKPRNYSGFYSERRAMHPEKYAVPDLWWSSK